LEDSRKSIFSSVRTIGRDNAYDMDSLGSSKHLEESFENFDVYSDDENINKT
jgi:hypothetical protein